MKSLSIHIFIVICFLTACMTMPKALRKVINSPEATNEILKLHPCTPVIDSVISKSDTILHTDTITNVGFFVDTLTKWRDSIITKTITNTKLVHKTDSVFGINQRTLDIMNNVINIGRDSIAKQHDIITKLQQQVADKSAESKGKDKWIWIAVGAIVLLLLTWAFNFYKAVVKI